MKLPKKIRQLKEMKEFVSKKLSKSELNRVLTKFANELDDSDKYQLSMLFVQQFKANTFISVEQTVIDYINTRALLAEEKRLLS